MTREAAVEPVSADPDAAKPDPLLFPLVAKRAGILDGDQWDAGEHGALEETAPEEARV